MIKETMIKETISCDICHSIMEPDTNCDIDFLKILKYEQEIIVTYV